MELLRPGQPGDGAFLLGVERKGHPYLDIGNGPSIFYDITILICFFHLNNFNGKGGQMVSKSEHSEIQRRELDPSTTLDEMQQGNVLMILVLLLFIGIILITASAQFVEQFNGALVGVFLYILIGIVWVTRHVKYLPEWLLVIGTTAVILFLGLSAKISPMLYMVKLSGGLAVGAAVFYGVEEVASPLPRMIWVGVNMAD